MQVLVKELAAIRGQLGQPTVTKGEVEAWANQILARSPPRAEYEAMHVQLAASLQRIDHLEGVERSRQLEGPFPARIPPPSLPPP